MSLLDDASLLVTPNAYKEGKLYSVIPSNGNGDFSVTRATTATRVNAAGLVELVPYNLVQYSEQFNQTFWFKNNLTITANTIAAPNGALTADTATATITGNCNLNIAITPGGTCTQSYYVKKNTARYAYIFRNGGTTAGFIYDFDTNTITFSAGGGSTFTATPVGDGWVRLAHSTDMTFSGTMDIGFSSNPTTRTINSGESGYLWGAQVVQGTSALDYQATETRLNIPRLDYSLGSCPNILLEPQRTNVVLHSADLSQSVWSKTNYSLASTTSIQGLNTTRITKNAVNNGFYAGSGARNLINTIGTFAAGTKTLTYLIRKGNTDKVGFIINNVLVGALTAVSCEFNFNTQTFTNVSLGLTTSFESPSANVYRISFTINDTGTGTSKAIWIAPIDASNNTIDGGYLDFAFAQWEAGAYATSYIPTTSASVTRNADVISRGNIFTNGLITASGGTWFVDIRNNRVLVGDSGQAGTFLGDINNGFAGNCFLIRYLQTPIARQVIAKRVGGVFTNLYTTLTDTAKIAIKWNGTTADVFVNGVKVVSATAFTATALEFLTAIGGDGFRNINSMALFPTPLTDTQCIALTT
jgi:hypothetical protein